MIEINNYQWYTNPQWIAVIIQGIMLAIAIAAIFYAYKGIKNQITSSREIAKKTKAIDLIFEIEQTDLHEKGLKVIYKYEDSNEKSIARLAEKGIKKDDVRIKERTNLANLLNYYEYMAVAIKHNIICEDTLKKANFKIVLSIVKVSKPFIEDIRTKYEQESSFKELEWLYDRWKDQEYEDKCAPIE